MSDISPRLQKGAILSLDATTGIPLGTIALQYNPESITRSLKPQTAGEQPDRSEVLRLTGPPIETIRCTAEIDATDQLAAGDSNAMSFGIQPQLAALELLVYPSSAELILNEALTLLGTIEILVEQDAYHAGAHHGAGNHRGSVRPAAQPHPRQGDPGNASAQRE